MATGLIRRSAAFPFTRVVKKATAFNPNVEGAGFEWTHLAVRAAWAVAWTLVGSRLFRWTPTENH